MAAGVNLMADKCGERIDALKAQMGEARTRRARRNLQKRIEMIEDLEEWCKTRAGYVE